MPGLLTKKLSGFSISVHQRSSASISGPGLLSAFISVHQRSRSSISVHQRLLAVRAFISVHQRLSAVRAFISGPVFSSASISGPGLLSAIISVY
ncbi:MAG: hypothetical protein ACK5EO_18890 [Planctomycetota bacterium]